MADRRAVGIIRVSETKGREGESFISPKEQADRIRQACERDGLKLVRIFEELDVSGGKPLDQRPGLKQAVSAIEDRKADVIAAAYFDRLFRSLSTQAEVIDRVETAGGQVLAIDVGQITNGSAGQWLSGTMLGAVAEYFRRSVKERSAEAQARAVARGVIPWSKIPPGYLKKSDGTLKLDPKLAPVIVEAYRMRVSGATIEGVREFLRENGIERSYHGATEILKSRLYLGEIHFGKLVNLNAHEPIIERDLFLRVQRLVVPRGRKPKSDRLLARLGVLRCGTCNSRMVVATSNNSNYQLYRCPPNGDCERRAMISAQMVEGKVVEAVQDALEDVEGRANASESAQNAVRDFSKAQDQLDAAIRAFSGLEDETAARERLAELREARNEAQERMDRITASASEITITAAGDWDTLTLDERRDLIKAVIERVSVAPGRGPDRISVELF